MARTYLQISEAVRGRVLDVAARLGLSPSALASQLVTEGVDQVAFPGVLFRGRTGERRACLAGRPGPEVWEVIARLQDLAGSQADRVAALSAQLGLAAGQVEAAIGYAGVHAAEVQALIDQGRAARPEVSGQAPAAAAARTPAAASPGTS